jgi:hypothetical protein
LRPPGAVRPAGDDFESNSPARSRWIAELGRIGFMSTQRREDRSAPATKMCSWGHGIRWQCTNCAKRTAGERDFIPARVVRHVRAIASAETARPFNLATTATTSLPVDRFHRLFVWSVRLEVQDIRGWTSPEESGSSVANSRRATRRRSLPRIPIPSDFAFFRQALPQDPVGDSRWAERYDGKGNLHFKHAA